MSDDAIQDLLDELPGVFAGDTPSSYSLMRAQAQHEAHRARVAELTSALEGRAAEVAQLQARAETAEAERSAFVQVMRLQCDHATARAEKAEAECERLRKLVPAIFGGTRGG